MKGMRWLARGLALLLVLPMLTVSAWAVSFSDMTNHWAREDVEYLANYGIVNGTSDTTFSPDRAMTACEAVIFCSRATGVNDADKTKIAAAWRDTINDIMPADLSSWAGTEMAVCLETGIISEAELRVLAQNNGLIKTITRQDLAMYLVRAMQLEPLAKSLSSYPMSFADASSISAARQPYVYILNSYGIVEGDQANRFLPDRSLTRAEMAVMLRRAIDFMDEKGIYAELPAYTTYDWTGGVISTVTAGENGSVILTLNSDLTGLATITLPSNVRVYENNMLTGTTALRVGQYARINLDSRGNAQTVRLGGALAVYSGTVSNVTQDQVTVISGGSARTFEVDRFTRVKAGGKLGGPELIDLQAGYTEAACYVDAMGHLAGLQLTGGSRTETGILVSIVEAASGQNLQIAAFNGQTQQYTLPVGGAVTVNGVTGSLSSAYVGDYVTIRVSNEEAGQLLSVAVDTVTEYLQGVVRNFTYSKDVNTITISKTGTSTGTTYDMLDDVAVRYNGEAITLRNLTKNSYATVRFYAGKVAEIDAWPGSTTTGGVIESIVYGSPTTLSVQTTGGQVATFEIDLSNLPTVYRDDKISSIDKLRTGDSIVVTVRYNQVYTLEATSQKANVTGTITRVLQDTSGLTIDVQQANGATVTYTVPSTVSVTQDGAVLSAYSLKVNDRVAMVVSGGEVVSIEVEDATGNQITATVLLTNTKEKTMMIQLTNGSAITVDVSDAGFVTAAGGSTSLNLMMEGDKVQLYGQYVGATFKATLVVRM